MTRPLAIDLFCGLGGWTDGLLAEGYDVIGFDIERHQYGDHRYAGKLVIQDVRTLHGSQFRNADLIVGSSPCQEFSYRAMPWKRAKALGPPVLGMELFNAQFRIQREACEAAGRHIPLIAENVRGAQKWVGRARWNYGSFYLWGDVPALMPQTLKAVKVSGVSSWSNHGKPGYKAMGFNTTADQRVRSAELAGVKCTMPSGGDSLRVGFQQTAKLQHIRDGHAHTKHLTNPAEHTGLKVPGLIHGSFPPGGLAQRYLDGSKGGGDWFGSGDNASLQRKHGSKSKGRKMASAMIAKIPLPLSRHIAATFYPGAPQLCEAAE